MNAAGSSCPASTAPRSSAAAQPSCDPRGDDPCGRRGQAGDSSKVGLLGVKRRSAARTSEQVARARSRARGAADRTGWRAPGRRGGARRGTRRLVDLRRLDDVVVVQHQDEVVGPCCEVVQQRGHRRSGATPSAVDRRRRRGPRRRGRPRTRSGRCPRVQRQPRRALLRFGVEELGGKVVLLNPAGATRARAPAAHRSPGRSVAAARWSRDVAAAVPASSPAVAASSGPSRPRSPATQARAGGAHVDAARPRGSGC